MQINKDLRVDATVLIYSAIFGIALPIIALFMLGAVEDSSNLNLYTFYGITLFFCVLVIAFAKFTPIGRSTVLGAFLFDPERGFLSKDIRILQNLGFVFYTALIFAIGLGLFSVITGTFFFGITSYQIIPLGKVFMAGEPASLTETLIQAILIGVAWKVAQKNSSNSKSKFWVLFLSLSFLSVFIMYGLHFVRYGASETNLMRVLVMFTVIWLLFIAFGNFIMPYLLHFFNNTLYMTKQLFSSDAIIVTLSLVYILLIVGYIYYIISLRRRAYA